VNSTARKDRRGDKIEHCGKEKVLWFNGKYDHGINSRHNYHPILNEK